MNTNYIEYASVENFRSNPFKKKIKIPQINTPQAIINNSNNILEETKRIAEETKRIA